MKRIAFLTTLASLAVLSVSAQDAPPPKVTLKPAKIGQVDTPMFSASNVGDRHWKPKAWMEVDVEFEAKLPAAAGGRNGSIPSMVVNVYVALSKKSKDNKTQFIKGSFTCVDIPSNEKCHLLAYVSPATLRRILEKEQFNASSDTQGWGVELVYDGKRIAAEGSPTGPWWESDKVELLDGNMLSKKETPFAMLWGDYDVSVKKQ